MKRDFALVAVFTVVAVHQASAATRPDCLALAAKVQAATSARQVQTLDTAVTLEMDLPKVGAVVNELQVVCPEFAKGPAGYSLVGSWASGSAPSDAFFRQVGSAGAAMTGANAGKVEGAARACTEAAVKSQLASSELDAGEAYVNCQSLQRLGGATTITIYHSLPAGAGP